MLYGMSKLRNLFCTIFDILDQPLCNEFETICIYFDKLSVGQRDMHEANFRNFVICMVHLMAIVCQVLFQRAIPDFTEVTH